MLETERLWLRELEPEDAPHIFELDSDPEVHTYLGRQPITQLQQASDAIAFIRQQDVEKGIGRWAVIEKSTNAFLGWSGLKLISGPMHGQQDFYELGYRFMKKYWGKGYATETAQALVQYGFEVLNQTQLFAITDTGNDNSRKVLEKAGLRFVDYFMHDGEETAWYEIRKES